MLTCRKDFFSLEQGFHYINCAYMSPLMKLVEEAGMQGMFRKRNPFRITPAVFFDDALKAQGLFAEMVNVRPGQVALIPSASYGLAIVAQNLQPRRGGKIITVAEEFPSDVYTLHRVCREHGLELITIQPPLDTHHRGKVWNERLLEAILPGTVMVNISSVHWADGTLFDLEAIGRRVKEVEGLFVVDGTQSVGAMEMDIKRFHIDALICAGYKWLLGPYTSGFAYFSEYFNQGKPLEETWLNRLGSEDFQALVNYQQQYKPGASRYNMGEYSNFINLPMQIAALTQLLSWTPEAINAYDQQLTAPLLQWLRQNDCWLEEDSYRANHLFGFRLPDAIPINVVQQKLTSQKVIVSLRGSAVRVSPHVYNDNADMDALMESLDEVRKEF